jgi:glutamate carboxypeptidase
MTADATLLDYFERKLPDALDLLRKLVELESYSSDKTGVDALARFLAGEFEQRGAEAGVLQELASGNPVQAIWRSGASAKPAMLLGHLDTVFPRGTLALRPFRVENGRAFGPGVFDMKSGVALSLLVCEAFHEGMVDPGRDVIFFFTADEETGTAAGLPHLEKVAADCGAVLCLEPPLPGGGAKTSRKGIANFGVRTFGVAAHSGIDYEKGASAILELCRIAIHLHEMSDPSRGLTVNVGTIRGGTASNVVPDAAEAEVEIRFSRAEDGALLESAICSLRASDPRCRIEISAGINRPPLIRSSDVIGLYLKAREAAARFGVDLAEGGTGGGSDGCFTAAWGIPTLDGLGCRGDGAHAAVEYIETADLPLRAATLCRLLQALD